MEMSLWMMLFTATVCSLLSLVLHMYRVMVLNPWKIRSKLEKQGFKGPHPSFIYGNIPEMKRIMELETLKSSETKEGDGSRKPLQHNWPPKLFPYYDKWSKEYGGVFIHSTGNIQILFITDPGLIKEVSLLKSLDIGKPTYLSKDMGALFGDGVITSNGENWVHQRKVIAPEFYLDKVKGMVSLMAESTLVMLRSWENKINMEGEGEGEGEVGGSVDIRVDQDLQNLTADVIAKASFGSSYSQGKEIFAKLRTLQSLMSSTSIFVGIPGLRHLPTKNNRCAWKLEKEVHAMILEVVKKRMATSEGEKDLLQKLLEAAGKSELANIDRDKFIIDNCKNIYFAGHETTATTASWALVLLAAHPEWQNQCRAEIQELCGDKLPDADLLRNMKTLAMVVQEMLRLYPPSIYVAREVFQDLKLKDILIPKGTNLRIPITMMHRDADVWGEDVHEFNPGRFSKGIGGACKGPQCYMPFGMGARTCLGQNFATMELKIILALILQRFRLTLSPGYRHAPSYRLVIEPGYGVNLLLQKV